MYVCACFYVFVVERGVCDEKFGKTIKHLHNIWGPWKYFGPLVQIFQESKYFVTDLYSTL